MDEKKTILEMLAAGKISVSEAEHLLAAVNEGSASAGSAAPAPEKKNPKFLRVEVSGSDEGGPETVNVRVPFNLLRAGVRLASLMPAQVQGQVQASLDKSGISLDLSKAKPEDLEEMINHLADLQIDAGGKDKVRIFCE